MQNAVVLVDRRKINKSALHLRYRTIIDGIKRQWTKKEKVLGNRNSNQKPLYSTWCKAGAGIEPANSGFADRDLTTWLPRRTLARK